MLVRRYKCCRRLSGPWSADTVPCYNVFYGPEHQGSIEEVTCPFCGKKNTLVMYKKEWQVEPDTHFSRNIAISVDIVEKPEEEEKTDG